MAPGPAQGRSPLIQTERSWGGSCPSRETAGICFLGVGVAAAVQISRWAPKAQSLARRPQRIPWASWDPKRPLSGTGSPKVTGRCSSSTRHSQANSVRSPARVPSAPSPSPPPHRAAARATDTCRVGTCSGVGMWAGLPPVLGALRPRPELEPAPPSRGWNCGLGRASGPSATLQRAW